MTGDDMVAGCKSRFRDPNNVIVTDAEWLAHVNDGYFEFIRASDRWPFLETAATVVVTPPSNEVALAAQRVLSVFNTTDDLPMDEIQGRRGVIDTFPSGSADTGVPTLYFLFNTKLQVFPWPAVATSVVVEFMAAPAALVGATSPVFPTQYHRGLISFALAQAYVDDENLELAAHHEGRWQRTLEQMRSDLLAVRGDSYPQIVDTF